MLLFPFSNHCPTFNFKTCSLCHPDFERTCLQRRFLPAVCMQLLCMLQPPDVFDYNSTVVNFKDITIPTAGISAGKQSRQRKLTATKFRWELCLWRCCETQKKAAVWSLTMLNHHDPGWKSLPQRLHQWSPLSGIHRGRPDKSGVYHSAHARAGYYPNHMRPSWKRRSHMYPRFPELINPKFGMVGTRKASHTQHFLMMYSRKNISKIIYTWSVAIWQKEDILDCSN